MYKQKKSEKEGKESRIDERDENQKEHRLESNYFNDDIKYKEIKCLIWKANTLIMNVNARPIPYSLTETHIKYKITSRFKI